jgi:hypothetical protein
MEDRMMLDGVPLKLGVMGDSLSDEYEFSGLAYAENWVDQLAASGNVDFGPVGFYGLPRFQAYEYNWALWGSTSATLLANGQASGLAAQIPGAGIEYTVLELAPTTSRP